MPGHRQSDLAPPPPTLTHNWFAVNRCWGHDDPPIKAFQWISREIQVPLTHFQLTELTDSGVLLGLGDLWTVTKAIPYFGSFFPINHNWLFAIIGNNLKGAPMHTTIFRLSSAICCIRWFLTYLPNWGTSVKCGPCGPWCFVISSSLLLLPVMCIPSVTYPQWTIGFGLGHVF